jgi:capsule polysaccharide export protein KpsC/LpsZ
MTITALALGLAGVIFNRLEVDDSGILYDVDVPSDLSRWITNTQTK